MVIPNRERQFVCGDDDDTIKRVKAIVNKLRERASPKLSFQMDDFIKKLKDRIKKSNQNNNSN